MVTTLDVPNKQPAGFGGEVGVATMRGMAFHQAVTCVRWRYRAMVGAGHGAGRCNSMGPPSLPSIKYTTQCEGIIFMARRRAERVAWRGGNAVSQPNRQTSSQYDAKTSGAA